MLLRFFQTNFLLKSSPFKSVFAFSVHSCFETGLKFEKSDLFLSFIVCCINCEPSNCRSLNYFLGIGNYKLNECHTKLLPNLSKMVLSRSSLQSGCAMSLSACERCFKVFPKRFATPNSVTTYLA